MSGAGLSLYTAERGVERGEGNEVDYVSFSRLGSKEGRKGSTLHSCRGVGDGVVEA